MSPTNDSRATVTDRTDEPLPASLRLRPRPRRADEAVRPRHRRKSREEVQPYAEAAHLYLESDVGSPLPVGDGTREKWPPPKGFTGYGGAEPTAEDVAGWIAEGRGGHNIAVRVATDVIGIDVDHYGDKRGGDTIRALEAKLGCPLPKTIRSSSRADDEVSGIRWFRVPAGLRWKSVLGDYVEIIQHGHRYAMVPPSIHPEGGVYRFDDERDDTVLSEIPRKADLEELTEPWVTEALSTGPRGGGGRRRADDVVAIDPASDKETSAFLNEVPGGEPCPRIRRILEDAEQAIGASRHPTATSAAMTIIRAGEQGHHGADKALLELSEMFEAACLAGPQRAEDRDEFDRSVRGAVAKVLADPTPEENRRCCGGRERRDLPKPGPRRKRRRTRSGEKSQPDDGQDLHGEPGEESSDGVTPDEQLPIEELLSFVYAKDVATTRVRYLWDRRIPLGAMTLLPGEESIGKTTVGVRLMADLTRGKLEGELLGRPKAVIVVGPEDGLEDIMKPRFEQAGADLGRVVFVQGRYILDDSLDGIVIPRDLDLIGRLAAKVGAALVWFDSLVTVLPPELKSISYKEVATVVRRINDWASEARLAAAAPWHLNKGGGSDPAARMMDSRAFRTAVRSVLFVVADSEAEEGQTQGLVVLNKANATAMGIPAKRYRIRSAVYEVTETDEETGEVVEKAASCGVADWIGEVEGDHRDLIKASFGVEKENTAVDWLTHYLKTFGETERQDVLEAGKYAGHSARSVDRAAARIQVYSADVSGTVIDPETGKSRPYRKAVWSLSPISDDHSADTEY